MTSYTNSEIVDALRKRDPGIVKQIYGETYSDIKWLVYNARASDYDPRDLFNDVFYILFLLVDKPDFILSCSINTYVIKLCTKQLKYAQYRSRISGEAVMEELDAVEKSYEPRYEELFDMEQLFELIRKHLMQMMKSCKRILNLHYHSYSNSEIAKRMKRAETAIRKLKSKCKKRLLDSICGDPGYRKIQKSDNLL